MNIDGSINTVNSTISSSGTYNFTVTFEEGTFNWNVNCTDDSGNVGNSSVRSFTIEAPPLDTSGEDGGGGGGGGGGGLYRKIIPGIKGFNLDKTLIYSEERKTKTLMQHQQYAVTSYNNLALMPAGNSLGAEKFLEKNP